MEKTCTIAAVSWQFIFPYTKSEENPNFSSTAALKNSLSKDVTLNHLTASAGTTSQGKFEKTENASIQRLILLRAGQYKEKE